jgi:hypothetical protein
MHATNTFPVDRHPQYRHYPTTIRSIASGIIIEVRKKYTSIYIYIHFKIIYIIQTFISKSNKTLKFTQDIRK